MEKNQKAGENLYSTYIISLGTKNFVSVTKYVYLHII